MNELRGQRPLPPIEKDGSAGLNASGEQGPRAQLLDCVRCAIPVDHRCDHCGAAAVAGGYRVVRILAESARGRMYEAVGEKGETVALKELVFATVPSSEVIEQFLREAKVLQQLRHPRIPRFIASFTEGNGVHRRVYLAQAFERGETLLQRLQSHRYTDEELVDITRQVLELLTYLHGLTPKLVHRDIKPSNLIRRPDGSIALVDFDTARDVPRSVTHRSTLVGTFGYMPPEQMGGTVDPSSDVYALAATILHLATRREPAELIESDLTFNIQRHIALMPALHAVLTRALSIVPQKRFPDARAALAALNANLAVVAKQAAGAGKAMSPPPAPAVTPPAQVVRFEDPHRPPRGENLIPPSETQVPESPVPSQSAGASGAARTSSPRFAERWPTVTAFAAIFAVILGPYVMCGGGVGILGKFPFAGLLALAIGGFVTVSGIVQLARLSGPRREDPKKKL